MAGDVLLILYVHCLCSMYRFQWISLVCQSQLETLFAAESSTPGDLRPPGNKRPQQFEYFIAGMLHDNLWTCII